MKAINSRSVKITKDTSDILKLYFQDIRKIGDIPKEKEMELFHEFHKTKCPKIKKLLINNNLRFVLNVSKHYHNGDFYELSDVVSSGNIGLIKAIEQFDPNKGFKFSTYAIWWIKQSILEGIAKESKMIKQPIKSHSTNQKFINLKNKFYNDYGFEPNIEDVRDGIGEETASEILAKSINAIDDNNIISMHKNANNYEDLSFSEILPTSILDDSFIYSSIDIQNLKFKNLNKIEKVIIYYKYGFEDKPELSFNQISKLLNMKETEIKKIHNKALNKIKNDL